MQKLRRTLSVQRADNGVYMLELIMAIAASGVLSAALVSSMAESQKLSNAGQNQIIASAIAQEQVDNARNTSYGNLLLWKGVHHPGINKNESDDWVSCDHAACTTSSNCRLNLRPLQIDNSTGDWDTATDPKRAERNRFMGEVIEEINDGPYTDTLQVLIEIRWKEGSDVAIKRYRLATLISKDGIHN